MEAQKIMSEYPHDSNHPGRTGDWMRVPIVKQKVLYICDRCRKVYSLGGWIVGAFFMLGGKEG